MYFNIFFNLLSVSSERKGIDAIFYNCVPALAQQAMGYMLHSTTLVMIFTKLQVLLLARLGNMELECELI